MTYSFYHVCCRPALWVQSHHRLEVSSLRVWVLLEGSQPGKWFSSLLLLPTVTSVLLHAATAGEQEQQQQQQQQLT